MKASGAGAGAQNVMGTGVFWGMLIATGLGVFIIPGNFTFVEGLGRRKRQKASQQDVLPLEPEAESPVVALHAEASVEHSTAAALPDGVRR
jgi:hypothetical protein